MKKLVIMACMAVVVSVIGCSSTQVDSGGGSATRGSIGQAARPAPGNQGETNPLTDPGNILFKRSAYFDFNKYDIKPEYRSVITAHARYLKDHPQVVVEIQGNCDERGSKKYNQALGLKRANAVKQVMIGLGVSDKQVTVISFGKDRPDARGHDKRSWALNRRGDIVYAGESHAVSDASPQNSGWISRLAYVEK